MRCPGAARDPNAHSARPLSPFEERVARVVRRIPKGSVLSYAQVALRAGKPGAARAVVRALHRLEDVPWWRVVRSDRTLAEVMVSAQAPRLRREGIRVVGRRLELGERPVNMALTR